MRAYRMEHFSGVGPIAAGLGLVHYHYALDAIQRGVETAAAGEHISELSQADGLQHLAETYHNFGCLTLTQLRKWFPSPLGCEAMERAGAVLRAFDVKERDATCAATRVMFDRRLAPLLWEVPASRLHSLTDEAAAAM